MRRGGGYSTTLVLATVAVAAAGTLVLWLRGAGWTSLLSLGGWIGLLLAVGAWSVAVERVDLSRRRRRAYRRHSCLEDRHEALLAQYAQSEVFGGEQIDVTDQSCQVFLTAMADATLARAVADDALRAETAGLIREQPDIGAARYRTSVLRLGATWAGVQRHYVDRPARTGHGCDSADSPSATNRRAE